MTGMKTLPKQSKLQTAAICFAAASAAAAVSDSQLRPQA
jgi:hypothetical protein